MDQDDLIAFQPRRLEPRGVHEDVRIFDMQIGSIIESDNYLSREKAWEAIESAFPGIYKIEQLVQLSDRAWAVYD